MYVNMYTYTNIITYTYNIGREHTLHYIIILHVTCTHVYCIII